MIVLSALVLFLILIIISKCKRKETVKRPTINSSFLDLPLVRHAFIFLGSNEDRMNVFKKLAYSAFSNKYGASTIYVGPYPVTFTSDPEQALTVLKHTNHKGHVGKLSKRLIGNGLAFAPEKLWQRRRKVLFPSFSSKHLAQFVHVFESQTKTVVKKLEPQIEKGNFSMWDYLNLNSLDSICETAFGINLKIQSRPDRPLFDDLTQYLKNLSALYCQPLLGVDAIYNILPISKEQTRLKQKIYNFIDDVIHKKKAMMSGESNTIVDLNGAEFSSVTMECFLEAMIKNSNDDGKNYTLKELREEVLTLAIAGSDTSATATCFAITLLAHHSDIQDKVYQELLKVLKEDKPLEIGDVQKLKYIDAVVKETLRLYPPVPVINRYLKQEIQLLPGLLLEQNETAVINVWGLHHNPNYWGPDVEEFNPDRFISRQPPVAGSYLPFSNGPRNCIGYQYAMLSMKTTIAVLLRHYRIKPATSFSYGKNNPLRVTFDVMLRHVDDFQIQIERR